MARTNGWGSSSYASSMVKSAEDVNSKTSIVGTGWSGTTWTWAWEDPSRAFIRSSVKADESSTVFFDFWWDGIEWNSTFPVAWFDAGTFHEYHGADLWYRYFRVRVVFDTMPTEVAIHTVYSDTPPNLNSPLSQPVSSDQDAATVKAILHGEDENTDWSYIQAKMASDGALKTSNVASLINFTHDYYEKVDPAPSTTTDRYDYYTWGSGGTKVAEILVTYETTAKNEVISAWLTLI